MWSETRRPQFLDGIVGHTEVKQTLQSYFQTKTFDKVILLHGPPGIGKTTIALASTKTFGYEALEVNASRSLRSFADVETLIQSCRHSKSISSMIRGDNLPTCVVLDEIDGSDPHAQRKLVDWMIGPERKIPVLMTCNEIPRIMKSKDQIDIVRCYPPKPSDLVSLFPNQDVTKLAKQFKHDVRRMLQSLQYGESDVLPNTSAPTECSPEVGHILHQQRWTETDPMVLANERVMPSSHLCHSVQSH